MKHPLLISGIAVLALLASAALAHKGVKNPAVMARMNAMTAIADETKVLGDMAKGTTAFSAERARAAARAIAKHTARVPDLFAAPEQDPKSEALLVIWSDFNGFTALNTVLEQTATRISNTLTTKDDLRAGLRDIGAACTACHKVYRKQ